MNNFDRKKHWEKIYGTKRLTEVSWYQASPEISLNFISQLCSSKTAKIIDCGGGDSLLVDHLLELGYQDISVLDISEAALNRAQKRLGKRASEVKWILADASRFEPAEQYDFWHDRAAFHFLTEEKEIENYLNTIHKSLKPSGILLIGTFSENGPAKCSGLEVKQYSEVSMSDRLKKIFEKINCITVDHETPSESIQNFIFCSFRKIENN